MAGGAWSRLLLKGVGVELPQLKVRSNVLRTKPTNYPLTASVSVSRFALRKRQDGGLTIATSASSQVDLTPDAIRFAPMFLPAFRVQHRSLKLRLNRRFIEEAVEWRPGQADRASIFEAVRILDPEPDRATIRRMMEDVRASVPGLQDVEVAQSWAGMIDTTPDAIPCQRIPYAQRKLSELLLRELLQLDGIPTDKDDIRTARKATVKEIQAYLDRVDAAWDTAQHDKGIVSDV